MERIIQKVPPLLLTEEKNRQEYIPKVVSIGPYHHGKPELRLAEDFKSNAVDMFVSGGSRGRGREFYRAEVAERIREIKRCYVARSTDEYSDDELAEMMLRDCCFIIIQIMSYASLDRGPAPAPLLGMHGPEEWSRIQNAMIQHLGLLNMSIVLRDLFLLENQIPFSIVKHLINLRYGEDAGKVLVNRFLNRFAFGESEPSRRLRLKHRAEPLHLLEAFHRVLISDWIELEQQHPAENAARGKSWLSSWIRGSSRVGRARLEVGPRRDLRKYIHSFRSVTDLKAKGIEFEPSSSQSLKDVKFKSRLFSACLELPTRIIIMNTKLFFLNMIAYELSPGYHNNNVVTSYINLMKSLIESTKDVKELREKKILYNALGSDEEVLQVFKEIKTYSVDDYSIFHDVKDEIEAHCSSTMRTWIAELNHKYFRSPWSFIGFLAAITAFAISLINFYHSRHTESKK